ncbi:undecaprenyl diphosphate synthase family protein [Actinomyces sp. oral taxon 171]|uniref:undecaprenyl diphosphate synthase family protein n=1 Tax=Actinomyces sp. oral taxon 171 TaxID=706438 RepID=UPI0001F627A1|nr:undecaprenyl diphosphate synthase family protein [Actinomyces sp. oral taxon 171]EFW27479.1 di-trans,poly-cis-decaprenylcistransferase-like protein [Actinomyces sp. oral taxon 171 str. F0337]QCT33983.1 isoprenyl transferase [Actinomyces sp. oral taxon 171 str. F0337]
MAGDNLLYDIYERRLAARIDPATVPHHVGVILDGNRRWAKSMGFGAAQGHKRGADKIEEFLGWAEQMGVQVVTLWLLSTDNLSRDPAELSPLLDIIAHAVDELAETGRWSLRLVGAVDLLPEPLAERLRAAVVRSRPASAGASESDGAAGHAVKTAEVEDRRMQVNIAVGYGGRQEIADAVRELLRERAAAGASLEEVAASLSEEDITEHLYTKGQPDPDLVIRTSGEQRLSGFLLWQSVHSEYYFCEVNWPAFRRVDFLRALRDFAGRERRLGR